ncbi:MAG TPA: hypothetical protein VFJ07_12135, partial [Streptosporangiaceae bacterium]|nr:hypothetical protein [Streptosporangiaceae bacterium]
MTANGVAAPSAQASPRQTTRQGQLYPSPFDRHESGAERRHHRLPGEARLYPRLHRRCGLRLLAVTRSAHQPILAGRSRRGCGAPRRPDNPARTVPRDLNVAVRPGR